VRRAKWREIEGFPEYAISDEGEIANIRTDMPRRTSVNQNGIVKITLYRGRELHTRSVAVLVAEAFVDGQSDLFNTPIHLDGDRNNCRADNLMWRPRWFAVQYHRQFDSEEFHRMDVHIWEVNTGDEYYSVKEACMKLGLYYNHVYRSYVNEMPVPLTGHEFRVASYEEAIR
jgi:hypothetical protein